MLALILTLLLTATPALASQASDVQLSEYHRLSSELDKLAARQAWSGVERTYQALLETGVEPTSRDRVKAAAAAMVHGDLAAARERLIAVVAHENHRDAIETLYRIDTEYGHVELTGKGELVVEQRPFLPEAGAAVDLAAQRLEDDGHFSGHLPPGRYRFGYDIIEVIAGVQTVHTLPDKPGRHARKR